MRSPSYESCQLRMLCVRLPVHQLHTTIPTPLPVVLIRRNCWTFPAQDEYEPHVCEYFYF